VHSVLGEGRIKNFYSIYGKDPEWQSVDAFVCLHPAATCELFVPFNRTIIIVTTTRYEDGRRSVGDWRRWNDRLTRIAADNRNVIAANNQYDIEYMRSVTVTALFCTRPTCTLPRPVPSTLRPTVGFNAQLILSHRCNLYQTCFDLLAVAIAYGSFSELMHNLLSMLSVWPSSSWLSEQSMN